MSATSIPVGNHPSKTVTITINGTTIQIEPGRHTVLELKTLGGIAVCDELNEIRNGRPHRLPDNASTHIEGGERFEGSPGSCCAS